MPENWDGRELRQYIKDTFNLIVWKGLELEGNRKREYKNTIIINNM